VIKMALPPAWKVKRELRRLGKQFLALIRFRSISEALRRVHYEISLNRLLRETPGAIPFTTRVAVFVLFQPKGVSRSSLLALDHLAQEGWSVLVISNAPLSSNDKTLISARSSHVIERPNFGYDFGAYREGWRWLRRRGLAIDRLILMNDSTWFPLHKDDSSLRRMEALNVDLTGHIFKTERSDDPTNDHIESHLLMFGTRALKSASIEKFWSTYRMSDSRELTIDKGEKGIAQTCLAAGLVVKGLLDREGLMALLRQLPEDELFTVAKNTVVYFPGDHRRRASWIAAAGAGQPWRDDYLTWADEELASSMYQLLSATFVYPAVRFGGMGFIKKSNEVRFQLARMRILQEIDEGRIPPFDPIVVEELREKVNGWKEPADWRRSPHWIPDPLVL
jgi:hypothetical protein